MLIKTACSAEFQWNGSSMKSTVLSLLSLTLLLTNPVFSEQSSPKAEESSTWLKESELPEGFPSPGPFNLVTKKSYPAYRAATTATSGQNRGFWTLFRHIKRNEIAMTAPVEMAMSEDDKGELQMEEMAFLYRTKSMGTVGPDGKSVMVENVPPVEVLNYAWKGAQTDKKVAEAKEFLLAQAKKENLSYSGFRLLGYNSPSVKKSNRTYELQLVLKEK